MEALVRRLGGGQPGDWDRQADLTEAELCAQLVWGLCRAVGVVTEHDTRLGSPSGCWVGMEGCCAAHEGP